MLWSSTIKIPIEIFFFFFSFEVLIKLTSTNQKTSYLKLDELSFTSIILIIDLLIFYDNFLNFKSFAICFDFPQT